MEKSREAAPSAAMRDARRHRSRPMTKRENLMFKALLDIAVIGLMPLSDVPLSRGELLILLRKARLTASKAIAATRPGK